jgi:hypothetical protein
MSTDVSEERIAYIFRAKNPRARHQREQVAAVCSLQLPAHAGSSRADFSTLKMEAINSSETLVHTRSTRRNILECGILYSHRRENFKPYKIVFVVLRKHKSSPYCKILKIAFSSRKI